MAGLFLVRTDDRAFAGAALAEARAQYARHGFDAPSAVALPGWELLHWPYAIGGPECLLTEGEDCVAVAGTIIVDGLMGRPALERLRTMALPALDWSRIGGQFVALVRSAGRTFLFADYFAAFQLFHDADRRLFSTSLLAAAKALPGVSFDAQGVYELAFNVMPIGDDTVFAELKTLGPGTILELTEHGTVAHSATKPLPGIAPMPIGERLERHRARLEAIVGAHVRQFGNGVHCPLSGGLDSRLLLGALRAAGSQPDIYVYGPPGDADVTIAKAIGAAEGFHVEWINKAAEPLAPDAFAEQVERNFHAFDGLPTYGNIFDNGGNHAAQQARHAGGGLAASGGCGEIYRNFFYLPDRPISAAAVARTFYARFTREDATERFDQAEFLRRIAGKIADAAGTQDDRLSRGLVEHIYPRVRCRALFGREISLEARLSPYLMPFLDHQVVAEAMTLPLALKHAGRFEAMLLHAIDPTLARHMSAYGHDFAGPPSLRHRFDEWSSRVRPIWLRQRSYAIHRRLRPLSDEHGGLLGADYMGRVIDPTFPAMRRYFRMDRITDSGLWRRIANLEYLAAHLGSRLAG
ncbi:hypothetical protein LZK98_08060 [Sphingomonas cannabina]|uniref:hypothetical protein n=1 Tax=Sphingomonas cannabina TaxID=2899123 RepID=UPI001F1C3E08|nr:hypothetical protein [Sphingomonas cannabina]UIJ46884.1 hypothetical protein LZK98_08060 [Sphingomonas cannabina]